MPQKGRGLADAAAGVGAEGEGGGAGRDRRRRTAAAAAGDSGDVPGVSGGEEGRVFGGGTHAEFIQIALAQHHGALLAQAGDGGGVVDRDVVGQHLGGAGGAYPLGAEEVFDLHGNAGERVGQSLGVRTGGDESVGIGGLLASDISGYGEVGGQLVVDGGSAVEVGFGELDTADFALGESLGGIGYGELPELGGGILHRLGYSSSTARTWKKSPRRRGALRRVSSAGRQSSVSSSRITL